MLQLAGEEGEERDGGCGVRGGCRDAWVVFSVPVKTGILPESIPGYFCGIDLLVQGCVLWESRSAAVLQAREYTNCPCNGKRRQIAFNGSQIYVKGNIHPGRIAYIFKFGLT